MIPFYIKNSSFYQHLRCLIKIKFSYFFISCLILAFGLLSNTTSAQVQATGGTGKYRNNIYWLNFNALSIGTGDSKTFTFTVTGITVTVVIDQVTFIGGNSASRLIPYISGSYVEDRLNRLYNIGGNGTSNTLVNAIRTNQNGVDADFRIRTYASVNGQPADIGLVFGNAESDAPAEYTQGNTDGDKWKLLETFVDNPNDQPNPGDGRRITFSAADQTVRLQCNQNAALLYTQKALTSLAGPLTINAHIEAGGLTAMALGVMAYSEAGDAPATYGSPSHTLTPVLSGGNNPTPGSSNPVYIANPPAGMQLINPGTVDKPQTPRLGLISGDFDPATFVLGTNADADNKNGENDEDGIANFAPLAVNANSYSVTAIVANTSAANANLVGWIDFNRNGTFEASEGATATIVPGATTATLNWTGLTGMTAGQTYARFRISTNPALTTSTPSSVISNGEVEDYTLPIIPLDFGDAPASYGTLLTNNGPRHLLDNRIIIGKTIDGEPDGQPVAAGADANGTNGDGLDEDGFTTLPTLTAASTTYSLNVPLTNTTGTIAKLVGWVDFNKNGIFDPSEGVVVNVPNGSTIATLNWTGISNLTAGITYARLRLSTDNLTTSTTGGPAINGEVEDYSLVIQPSYDLGIIKTVLPTTATAGQPLTYTITLKNNGPSPVLATDIITLTDNLPPGFTATAFTPATGTYTSSNGSWTGLALASGQSTTLTITGNVASTVAASLNNTATVANPAGITDINLTNNSSSVIAPVNRDIDLSVTKTSSPKPVIAGQTLTYTITLTNNGPGSLLAADVVTLTDNLPAGFTATTYTAGKGVFNKTTGEWTGLTLDNGQSTTLIIAGTVAPTITGTLSNTVSVVAPIGTNDKVPGNNSATETTPVSRQIDFSLTKTATPSPVAAGQALTYTLTLKNNGLSSLLVTDIVKVVDNLPAGFTATAFTPATGTYTSTNGNWTGLTLASGQSTTLVITGTFSATAATGSLTNTAVVTSPLDITDPDLTNNTATNTVNTTRVIDLGVSKSATPATAVTGQALTYTITLTNSGPSALVASDIIKVLDNLPAEFTASNYTAGMGTYNSTNGNWTGLTLASGQSTTLIIAGTVAANANGSLSNTVSVTLPVGITDPNSANNTATITTPISRIIDLGITKTAAPKPAIAGQPFTYTITLSNNGTGALLAADIVKITDNLPAGFTATTFTVSNGTYTSSTGNWSGLTLINGQNATLTITGALAATASGSISNTVTVTPPTGVTDPTPANNTATDNTSISRIIDFGVNKSASPATGIPGETLTYTITLTNNGPGTLAATDVLQLIDNLPAGFTANTYLASAGTYTSSNGNWTGLTLSSGQSAILTITGKIGVAATGTLSNTATVTPPTGITDPAPGNNTSTTTTNLTAKPVLTITKLGAAGLTAGNTATYTLNISNTGSSNAVGASITDIIPAALTNVSWTSTVAGAATITNGVTGTGNNLNITANIPAGVANTISITITGTVNPAAKGNISNTATVTPAEPTGTGSNSTVNANVTSTSGIVITKTGPSAATAGNQITYQVEISNNGPSNATGTQITDIVPASLNNVSWTTQLTGAATVTTGASGTGNTINVTASISAGTSNKVIIIVKGTIDPSFAGNITNTATATPAEAGSTPVNAQAVTTVQKLPVFTVTKSGPATSTAGNAIVYTINVKNTGPSNSLNTQITDAVPAAITGVSWTATVTGGTAIINSGATGNGNAVAVAGNFAANSTIQVVISGKISSNASGTITNTATATPSEPGTVPVTSTPVNTVLSAKSGLTIVKSVTPTVNSGSSITYTVEVGNAGPSDALNAHVQDAIPASILNTAWTSVVQGTASISAGATGTGNTLDAIANIPAGSGNKIIFTITGKANPAFNGSISNTASVTATEPNSPSPTSTVNTIASRTPVLSIIKSGPSSINAGETITYTVIVSNNSASDALNLAISDLVPATVSGVSWTASTTGNAQIIGALTGNGNTINLNGNVASGSGNQITIVVTGKVAAGFSGSLTNTATVTPAEAGTGPASATATTNVTRIPVLAIQKNGPAALSAGQAITYTISVKNISQANATASVITDAIPASILNPTWITSTTGTATVTAGATGTGSALSVTGNIGGNPADEILITISGTVNPATTANISNSATVTPAETGAVPKTAGPVITTITKTPSVSLTKTGPATANAGETVSYVINVVNSGPSNATALVITDAVPAELTAVSWTATSSGTSAVTIGAAGNGNAISVTGNLNAGSGNKIQINVSGSLGAGQTNTTLNNTAVATPAEPGISPVSSNTVSTKISNKNSLTISKSGPVTVNAGEQVVYNLIISNNGPSNAVNAIITDQIPSGLTNVNWIATASGAATISAGNTGTGNNLSVTGNVQAGIDNHINVRINGTLNSGFTGASFSNTATITPSETGNNSVSSNTVTTTVTKTSDLRISKSGTASTVAGQPVSYTISVTNAGPSDVTGAQVTDAIPASILNPVWSVTSSGTAAANINNGTGDVSLLATIKANGTDALLITINGTLDPSFAGTSVTNTATVMPPAGVTDPTPATSTVITNTTRSANVRIVKSGPADAGAGQLIQYTLRITNAGPSTALAVNIQDAIPPEILDPSWTATASGGAIISTATSGTGNVAATADIPSGTGIIEVVITGTANPSLIDNATISNTATITSTIVPDPEVGNNSSSIVTKITNRPDFNVSKSGPETANIGDPITYTITINNSGAGDITNAQIEDIVPDDVQVTSWIASAVGSAQVTGTQSGTTNTINTTGNISAGPANTIQITVNGTVVDKGHTQFTNTVTVTSGNIRTSSVTTSVNKSIDLRIEKQGPATIAAGEPVTYTVKVFNNGPNDATSISIQDIVPAQVVVSNWTATISGNAVVNGATTGTTNAIALTGEIGSGAGNYITITVSGQIPSATATGNITNSATVNLTTAGLTDYNLTNNTSAITTVITNNPTLQVSKSGPQTAVAGEQIHYIIQVANNGPSDASGVNITDAIPPQLLNYTWTATSSGTAVITSTPATGTMTPPTVTANIPQGAGNLITIDITGTVDPAFTGTFTNTAQAQIGANPPVVSPTVSTVVSKVTALNIRKSGPVSTSAGLPIVYTIEVTNTGPSNALAAAITDAIPAVLQNVQWTATASGGASITSGATGTGPVLAVEAAIPGSGNAKVFITITGDIPSGAAADLVNSATVTEPGNPAVISNVVTTTLTKTPGLVLVKSGPATAASGEKITYTLNLTNAGPSDATATAVTDVVDPAIKNVQWTTIASGGALINLGATGTSNQVVANVNVPVGGTISVTITGDIDPTYNNSLTNTATATPAEPGINPVTSTVTTVVKPVVNLSITKSGPATLLAGEEINYEIRVTNSGPSTALNAAISDIVQADVVVQQWSVTQTGNTVITGASSGTTNTIATNANLTTGAGDALIIAIKGAVAPSFSGTLTNTATVTAVEDPLNPKTSVPVVTAVSRKPVVKIVKTGPATLTAGATINYLITVNNEGTGDALNLDIADNIPAVLTGINWQATAAGTANVITPVTGGTTANIALKVNVPAGAGNTITITVSGKVPADNSVSPLINTATATPAEVGLLPQTSTVSTVVNRIPVIEITKSGPANATAGTQVEYIITAVNTGVSDALGTVITDAVPAALTNVNWVATPGGAATITAGAAGTNNNTVSVTANIPAGNTNTVTIRVTGFLPATATANLQNTATATPIEPGATPQTTPPVTTTVAIVTDLAVTNTVNQALQKVGQPVTFTVQVTNNGPSNASGVQVTDLLPAGYTIISQSATTGTYDPVSGLWTIGNLANGGVTTLTIQANVGIGSSYLTTAVVSGTETDPLLTNNTASIGVRAVNSDPVANPDVDTLLEDQTLTVTAANGLLANDTDIDNDVLSVSKFIIAGIAGDQLVGTAVLIAGKGTITINTDGGYTFVPAPDYNGAVPVITYTVIDGKGGIAISTLTLTVLPVNDAPSFVKGADQVLLQYSGAQTVPGWATAISAGPADEAGQKLNFLVTNANNTLFTIQPAIAPDGTLTFTPAAGAIGTVTVTVILKDDGGTANGGVDQSAPQTFIITLTPGNSGMTLTKVANNTGTKTGDVITYTIVATNTGNVILSNVVVRDPGADAGSIIPAVIPTIAPGAIATVTAKHTLTQADLDRGTYSNQAGATGTDPSGNPVDKPKSDDPDTPAPDDATVIVIGEKPTLTLVKTGVFNGNQITYTFTVKNTGTVTLNPVTFSDAKLGINNRTIAVSGGLVPGATASATEVYTLTQADKDAGKVTNTAIAKAKTPAGSEVTAISGTDGTNNTPTVIVVDKSPVAVDDKAEAKANTTIVIDILANDNPGNSSFDKSTVVIVTQPLHGKVAVNSDGTVSYTPDPGYSGPDNFTYQVKDRYGYVTNVASVAITLNFFEIAIPNLFTPNGDGTNDVFEIRGLNQYGDNELSIVNRWGNEVFRQKNYQNTWSGEGLNEGTYYYLLRVKPKGGNTEWQVFKGYITLIRTFKK
jgi:uncharacterized repeat protein (TIGR01451 family)/gliding motility-associated-like protein